MAKGVSEIVATVLMIALVTAIGFSLLFYSMGYFSSISSAEGIATSRNMNTIQERFIISDAIINATAPTNKVNVTVYDYGNTNVNIVAIYINGAPCSVTATQVHPGNPPVPVIGNTAAPLTIGNTVLLRVVSSLGNYYENTYTVEG